ncbi:hypothetical protein E2320_007962, partial [Naja naja]
DVKLTASNDDYYFVFEDYLYQVLLCFSRDTSVLEHFAYNSASPPRSFIRGKLGMEQYAVFYPPNVAPLCFLYNEPSKLYQIFREIYVRGLYRYVFCLRISFKAISHSCSIIFEKLEHSLLAAAVFAFRAGNLMEVTSLAAAE